MPDGQLVLCWDDVADAACVPMLNAPTLGATSKRWSERVAALRVLRQEEIEYGVDGIRRDVRDGRARAWEAYVGALRARGLAEPS